MTAFAKLDEAAKDAPPRGDESDVDSIGDETKYTPCIAGWRSPSRKSLQVLFAANLAAHQINNSLLLGWGMNFQGQDSCEQ